MKLSIIVALLVLAVCSAKPAFDDNQGVAGAGCSVPEVYFISTFTQFHFASPGLCRGDAVVRH